jgi:hypothetical protein
MTAHITFFPLGNADTSLIRLADKRLVLLDYANKRDPKNQYDARCDLPEELRKEMDDADQTDFSVVCFTHLDDDHVCGASDFFWLEHAAKYQEEGRPKIDELWVPAAAITEVGVEDSAWAIRQEARHRLKKGSGIKVFSRPAVLESFLADNGLTLESRSHCIVDAGTTVPGFSLDGAEQAEFFVHCPFAWRSDERGLEDRNQDAVVLQATFTEGGSETYALLGSDVNCDTIGEIVKTSRRHDNEDKLVWDILHLFHHCSYKSVGPERGVDETEPTEEVAWLIEEQSRDGAIIICPSKPIPVKGLTEDEDKQPPHRQAANYYRRILAEKDGEFKITMETPSKNKPKPFQIEITSAGARILLAVATPITAVTSTVARAG